MRAQFVLHEVWIGLRRNLTMTIALVVVVAISLSLLGTGLLFVKQVSNTRTYWQGKVQLSVYLCASGSASTQCARNGPVTPTEIAQVRQELQSDSQVSHVAFVSEAAAYRQFRQEFADNPSLVRDTLPSEIPSSFEVKLKNTQADAGQVSAVVDGAPGVDQVVQNSSVLDKFYKLLGGARNAVVIIAIILIIAAILLVANTIRLSAFNRRRETSIMRLVGASNFYVQLPFLMEGVFAGLVGWLVATGLLIVVKSLLLDGLQQYFPFNVQLSTTDLVEVVIIAMIIGLVLCGATSFLTLRRYLRA
ncbi:MAG TPA: permease-like cell division protein FtsX [Streptosporangiaceae bacterium]|nr:permease-like cell division protein FtsX [Streptosporangiaceae bacterium]